MYVIIVNKFVGVTSSSGTKQKVVITTNSMQNVILKPSAAVKTTQVSL